MPRSWDRSELQPQRTTTAEATRLARYAARLLAATASAIAITTMVVHGTSAALLEPVQERPEQPASAAEGDGSADDPTVSAGDRTPDQDVPAGASNSDVSQTSGSQPRGAVATQGGRTRPPPPTQDPPRTRTTDTPRLPPGPVVPESVTLTDDDQDLPLFQAGPVAPGQQVIRCITLTYTGPASSDIRMQVEATGELAAWLVTTVDVGATRDTSCSASLRRTVISGSLQSLSDRQALPTLHRATAGVPFSVRIITELPADVPPEAAGATAAGRFVWSTP